MAETQMTNGARGEIAMKLGGARYVLRPEFGIVAKIETALDTSMIKLAMKAELFDLKAEELVRTLRAVLARIPLTPDGLAKAVLDHRVAEYARKLAAERS